ncbi:putative metallophosphoesterase [Bacteroidales bacterium Barb6XT]|nr:putative metallophosphoesterase [Bacteroidales bacterium Barb6XT]
MAVFLSSVYAQLILSPFICWRGFQALPAGKWRTVYLLLFAAELCLYLTGFFFHSLLPDRVMTGIMIVCNTWYVASAYILLAIVILEALWQSNRFFPWFPRLIKEHWKQTKLILFVCVTTEVSALMVHAYGVAANPCITHVHLTIPKPVEGRDSLTIVMMSDLHIGEIIGKKTVQKYVALANAQHPDMTVLVGDITDYESRFAEAVHAEEDLQQLQSPLGTYIVYGNHEYRANRIAKQRWLRKTGGTVLVDSVVMPDSLFYLIGRDDYINRKRRPLHALMQGLDTSKPVIVLDHQPWNFAESAMNGADLVLQGHTHNGQLWPYPLLLKLIYECPYGYYRKGQTQYYVSSGIGFAGQPYRVGTVSELVVLHIKFAKAQI